MASKRSPDAAVAPGIGPLTEASTPMQARMRRHQRCIQRAPWADVRRRPRMWRIAASAVAARISNVTVTRRSVARIQRGAEKVTSAAEAVFVLGRLFGTADAVPLTRHLMA